jgi:hypothetical protein
MILGVLVHMGMGVRVLMNVRSLMGRMGHIECMIMFVAGMGLIVMAHGSAPCKW